MVARNAVQTRSGWLPPNPRVWAARLAQRDHPNRRPPVGYLATMATVTKTFLVDDIDGSTDDVENVQISLDGANFAIDLSAANAVRLREKLAKYVESATRVTPRRTGRSKRAAKPAVTSGRDQVQAVRDWARQNGYEVSSRGRIPGSVQQAFDAAH